MAPHISERYRFDCYEFVTSTGYLYRKGYPVRLSEQQGRLLMALLEHSGNVLSPEEIRPLLWPDGEHLDHNHAIRNTITQLRAILRDKPQQPRFIETLPKRGYRFIAEISSIPSAVPVEPATLPPSIAKRSLDLTPSPVQEAIPAAMVIPQKELAPADISPKLRRWWLAACFAVLLIAAISFVGISMYRSRSQAQSAPAVITLGIAPMDASGEAAQRLVEPFRMELIDAVSQLPGVEVRAMHSFPDGPTGVGNLHGLAQKLQLDALLLGRIEALDPQHFNFIFELVRGSDAVHLATFHYSGTVNQLSATRDRIQSDLFYRLNSLSKQHLKPVRSTENPAAYSAYLSGRADLIRHDDAAIQQAQVHFQQAIRLDPGFAQAYAGLGSAYLLHGEHSPAEREAAYAQSRAASLQAIRLNPDLGEAHATLGFLDFRHDWNPVASETEFRHAIELEPGQAMHRVMYALLLCNTGRSTEALEQIARAHDADPFWPPIYITEMYVASAARKNELALEAARMLLDFMPNWSLAHDQSAWAYWYAGHYEEAVQGWIRMAEIEQDQQRLAFERAGLQILKQKGLVAYSHYKLHAIEQSSSYVERHPNDFQLAEWQINAGEDEKAISSMERMVREHDPEALQFAVSPAYLRLHNNASFHALLVKIGLSR